MLEQLQRICNRILHTVRAQASPNQRVLVVSKETYDSLACLCERLNLELNYSTSIPLALRNLRDGRFDVVIYDHETPSHDWRTAVTVLAQASPGSSILLLSILRQPEIWNEVIRKGGHDILSKPISEDSATECTIALAKVRAKVQRILGDRRVPTP